MSSLIQQTCATVDLKQVLLTHWLSQPFSICDIAYGYKTLAWSQAELSLNPGFNISLLTLTSGVFPQNLLSCHFPIFINYLEEYIQ